MSNTTPAFINALRYLNQLIKEGQEFPDALWKAYNHTGFSCVELTKGYDEQFIQGRERNDSMELNHDREPANVVGRWFMDKWQDRLEKAGRDKVLTQMKKQGIPAEIAVALLYVQ